MPDATSLLAIQGLAGILPATNEGDTNGDPDAKVALALSDLLSNQGAVSQPPAQTPPAALSSLLSSLLANQGNATGRNGTHSQDANNDKNDSGNLASTLPASVTPPVAAPNTKNPQESMVFSALQQLLTGGTTGGLQQ